MVATEKLTFEFAGFVASQPRRERAHAGKTVAIKTVSAAKKRWRGFFCISREVFQYPRRGVFLLSMRAPDYFIPNCDGLHSPPPEGCRDSDGVVDFHNAYTGQKYLNIDKVAVTEDVVIRIGRGD
jgi:hypothetical protein